MPTHPGFPPKKIKTEFLTKFLLGNCTTLRRTRHNCSRKEINCIHHVGDFSLNKYLEILRLSSNELQFLKFSGFPPSNLNPTTPPPSIHTLPNILFFGIFLWNISNIFLFTQSIPCRAISARILHFGDKSISQKENQCTAAPKAWKEYKTGKDISQRWKLILEMGKTEHCSRWPRACRR